MQINGKELRITKATFDDAMDLQDAIGKALKGTKLELPEDAEAQVSPDLFGSIIDAVLGAAISKEVRACLFKCAEKALYDNAQINKDFFEPDANRELYYPIMVEIIKANVGPFIKGLTSQLGGLKAITASFRK
jgi:hypothetical protein